MLNAIQKEQDFFQTIALSGLAPLAGERTIQALFYIFRGRKANQTLQDVHMYRLHPYYRLFPRLSKEHWEEIVAALEQEGLITLQMINLDGKKLSYQLTRKGEARLQEGKGKYRLDEWTAPFRQITTLEVAGLFWLRLHLMVQTVSHLIAKNMSFFPVVQHRQVQAWVKEQLATEKKRENWTQGLFDELYLLLSDYAPQLQQLIVRQFSGEGQTGATLQQLAYEWQEAPAFLQVKMQHCIARMYQRLQQERQSFPLLRSACDMAGGADRRLSQSASETYRMIKQQQSIETIAQQRRLTRNTVEDHLVEIALHCPEWDITPYMTLQEQAEILEASKRLSTNRLRLIKDELGHTYSYLKIRLALARKGGGNDEHRGT